MSEEKEKDGTVRKIYSLPADLVDRIAVFQKDRRLPSEVEAVRRLLDEALMQRDTPSTIINRFVDRLTSSRFVADVARDVLVGHPHLKSISFEPEMVEFSLHSGQSFRIESNGTVWESAGGYDNWRDVTDDYIMPF